MTRESKAVPAGTATLTYGNKSYELPAFSGSAGPNVIDIRKLYGEADVFTYDPGFTSTASCESDITFIDGDKGILLYRGYPIDQLAAHSDFLEVCTCCCTASCPTRSRWLRSTAPSPIIRWCTNSWRRFSAASGAMRTRWR